MEKEKLYNLYIWTKVFIEQNGEHTFMWVDWAYCKWLDNNWNFWIWVNPEEEVKKEWKIYLLVN